MSGHFLTFEGIDGCGKSTQAMRLGARIESAGHTVLLTREPGATSLGRTLRSALLESAEPVSNNAELLLFAADRAQHVDEVIRPALARGDVVISDRFADSTRAYQGAGRDGRSDRTEAAIALATDGLAPDLTVLIDVDLETARSRSDTHRDRMEQEADDFFERVRTGFLDLARRFPERVVHIDGSGATDDVAETIYQSVAERLPKLKLPT